MLNRHHMNLWSIPEKPRKNEDCSADVLSLYIFLQFEYCQCTAQRNYWLKSDDVFSSLHQFENKNHHQSVQRSSFGTILCCFLMLKAPFFSLFRIQQKKTLVYHQKYPYPPIPKYQLDRTVRHTHKSYKWLYTISVDYSTVENGTLQPAGCPAG